MDKRVLIILLVVVMVVVGIAGALFFFTKQSTPTVTPTISPAATPSAATTQTQAVLSATSATPLSVGVPGTIDVYLNTKGTKIDGFQFIATVGGNALPAVPDSDSATDGTQIQAATLPEFSVSTNSVTDQDGTSVIRFAMIATDSTTGFSSASPVKVATIPVSAGTGGSVSIAFNQQNSRVRLTSGGEDALLSVTDVAVPVSATTASASTSGSLASTQTTVTPTPVTQTTTTSTTTNSPFCLASCFTDSDCAAGFVCETDRCVNPACPTSQTCGCGTTTSATPVATAKASASASPVSTTRPTAVPSAAPEVIANASSSGQLPSSGSFEYTLFTLGAGLLLVGGGVFLTAKQEA